MYDDLITNHFREFINERPAISPNRLAKELVYNRTNLQKIIIGKSLSRLSRDLGKTSVEIFRGRKEAIF